MMLALFSIIAVSCNDRNDDVNYQDYDTYSVVLDINEVNFDNNAQDGYHILRTFTKPLGASDVVLIYRKAGTANDGSAVWQSIPRTLYVGSGNELDFDFDFSRNDIMIYVTGNYDLATTPQFLQKQTFRVVLVPASAGQNKSSVDRTDYDSVIKYYNIDDSKVGKL